MAPAKLHILLVDDEAEIATLVASVLQRSGHAVDVAADGEAALAFLNEKPGQYQLVITDSNMPGVSGIQLVEHLRKTNFTGKVILLSGYVTSELQDVYQSLNIDRIIEKPFSFVALNAAVKEVMAGMETNPQG
jgi:DNA-binding response OmpR family regulator